MKSKMIATLGLGILLIAFQNCERSPFIPYEAKIESLVSNVNTNSTNPTNTGVEKKPEKHIVSIKYFQGGWFGPADRPNWAHDMVIEEKDNGYQISAKTTDALCGKTPLILGQGHIDDLYNFVSKLNIKKIGVDDGPFMIDGGVREAIIQFQGEEEIRVSLNQALSAGFEYYATNGDALAAYLEDLDNSLPVYCQ